MRTLVVEVVAPDGRATRLRARSIAAGQRLAREALGDAVTTNALYWRDVGRAGFARVYRRSGGVCRVSPRVIVVPSCGEVGWW